jgi:DNA-binding Lrp family transcriptional regulator
MKIVDYMDLKILSELVENAKTPLVKIGRKLDVHPNVVAYRINKMKRQGIIKDYTVELDFEKLGLNEQVYVGLSLPSNSEREKILQQIINMPQTMKVISSLGSPESIIFLVGKDKSEINDAISTLRNFDVKIEYTASVIKTYGNKNTRNFLNLLAH